MENNEESRSRTSARVLRLYLMETAKEVKQRKLNFCLGTCSVFIVVISMTSPLCSFAYGLGRYW